MTRALSVALALSVAGCESGSNEPQYPSLSGTVRDYFSGTPLAGVTLAFSDQPPVLTITSSANGTYRFSSLIPNSERTVYASLANYRATQNDTVSWTTTSVTADQFVVSVADASRQYTALGLTPVAGTAVVFIRLEDATGQPHTGIPVADITLNGVGGGPPSGVGPFIFGADGDVVPHATLAVTTAFNGRARVAFLDVPPGRHRLAVTFTSGTVQTKTASLPAAADAATLFRR